MLFSTGLHEAEGRRTYAVLNWAFLAYDGRPSAFSAERRRNRAAAPA